MNTDVFSALNVDRRKMLLAKVDAHLHTPLWLFIFFDLVLTTKLVLVAVPADLNTFRLLTRRPVDEHWISTPTIGKPEYTVISKAYRGGLPLHLEVALLLVGRTQALVVATLAFLSPRLQRIVEAICDGLSRLAVESVEALAVQGLGLTLGQPVALAVDEPPVPLRYRGPQIPGPTRQGVELVCAAQFEFAGQIHAQIQKPSRLSAGGTGHSRPGCRLLTRAINTIAL